MLMVSESLLETKLVIRREYKGCIE